MPRGKQSRNNRTILRGAKRCIYCAAPATSPKMTVEHMPPKSMFRFKDRPSGMEFASCERCNVGTRAADAAVAFFSRIDRMGNDVTTWKVKEALKYLRSAEQGAPGFANEMFGGDEKQTLFRTPGGIFVEVSEVHAGPIGQALLHVFAAKLGMALYHEHIGEPLPLTGGVQCHWYLNNGLSEKSAETFLDMLPVYSTLKQGERKSVAGQFDYRFNTDEKSIVAALTHFHGNIHFFTIAAATPELFGLPRPMPFTSFVRPGELSEFMPKPPSAILMQAPKPTLYPNLILPS